MRKENGGMNYEELINYENEFLSKNFKRWEITRTAGMLWSIRGNVTLSDNKQIDIAFTCENICFAILNDDKSRYITNEELDVLSSNKDFEGFDTLNEVVLIEVIDNELKLNEKSLLSEEDLAIVTEKFKKFLSLFSDK